MIKVIGLNTKVLKKETFLRFSSWHALLHACRK